MLSEVLTESEFLETQYCQYCQKPVQYSSRVHCKVCYGHICYLCWLGRDYKHRICNLCGSEEWFER